jgi:hypothetical protein
VSEPLRRQVIHGWSSGLRGCKLAIFWYAYRPIKEGGYEDRPYDLSIEVESYVNANIATNFHDGRSHCGRSFARNGGQ